MERGETAMELFFTIAAPDMDSLKNNTDSEHQLEMEIGMTDHFDVGFYQVISQAAGGSVHYDGFKLESRYRFGEKGDYFLDPLIYLEYMGVPDFSQHVFEAKFILARDFGPTNLSLNPLIEISSGDESETEFEYALGISRKINDLLRLGLEAKGGEAGNYIGPVISHGAGGTWVALGSAFGVGDIDEGHPEFELRLLMGFEL